MTGYRLQRDGLLFTHVRNKPYIAVIKGGKVKVMGRHHLSVRSNQVSSVQKGQRRFVHQSGRLTQEFILIKILPPEKLRVEKTIYRNHKRAEDLSRGGI